MNQEGQPERMVQELKMQGILGKSDALSKYHGCRWKMKSRMRDSVRTADNVL